MAEAKNRTGTGLWAEIPQLSLGLGLASAPRERDSRAPREDSGQAEKQKTWTPANWGLS